MPQGRALPTSAAGRADVAASSAALALAIWAFVVSGGRSTPIVLLLAGLFGGVVVGRHLTVWPGLTPKAIAAAIAGALVLTYPGLLSAGGAPTGYANSNATLAAVGALAASGAARTVAPGRERRAWAGLAITLAIAVLLTRSTGGILVLLLVALLLALSSRWQMPELTATAGTIVITVVLGITGAMAVDGSTPLASSDIVRVELWSAAVDLAREEPIRGMGGGGFEARNPVTGDLDLRWVHHEYLELAVELGGVGLLLVITLGLATMVRLAAAGRNGVIAAAAVTVVALHGTVDHVWHAPSALLLTAILVGDATGASSRKQRSPSVSARLRKGSYGPLPVT